MKKWIERVRKNQFLGAFLGFYQSAETDITSIAVAYYSLISVFPLLLILVNILPYFQIPVADFLEVIEDVLPETFYEVVAKIVRDVLPYGLFRSP